MNYGVRPDGSKFSEPAGYDIKSASHFEFWKGKDVPDHGKNSRILHCFGLLKVDGFRYDMAEMVPYEFWSYMNSAIKMQNTDAFFAEVYNTKEYRNYIRLGKMDYLYDKVETYDKLKEVIQGKSTPDGLSEIQVKILNHMLHFLRITTSNVWLVGICWYTRKGKPLMVVSTTISSAPTMIYFGQEVGEAGNENGGFGTHSRTSILIM
jgi:glycosidase